MSYISHTNLFFAPVDSIISTYISKDYIPIIINNDDIANKKLPSLKKKQFMVQSHITLGQFLIEVRNTIHLKPTETLLLFTRDHMLHPVDMLISQLYKKYRSDDLCLHFTGIREETYG